MSRNINVWTKVLESIDQTEVQIDTFSKTKMEVLKRLERWYPEVCYTGVNVKILSYSVWYKHKGEGYLYILELQDLTEEQALTFIELMVSTLANKLDTDVKWKADYYDSSINLYEPQDKDEFQFVFTCLGEIHNGLIYAYTQEEAYMKLVEVTNNRYPGASDLKIINLGNGFVVTNNDFEYTENMLHK